MTRTQFTSEPANCKRLAELLGDPVLATAIQIAVAELQPKEPLSQMGDIIHQAALEAMKTRGANLVVSGIFTLTQPLKKPSEQPMEYDAEATKALEQQGFSKEEIAKIRQEYQLTQNAS